MGSRIRSLVAIGAAVAVGFAVGRMGDGGSAVAQSGSLSALDYQEITQLINRYAYGIDTCANLGYDYANLFTTDGVFIDRNSDAGFAAGGRVLAQGRDALATLVGGGSRGCQLIEIPGIGGACSVVTHHSLTKRNFAPW